MERDMREAVGYIGWRLRLVVGFVPWAQHGVATSINVNARIWKFTQLYIISTILYPPYVHAACVIDSAR
jgi:hypothetical protein